MKKIFVALMAVLVMASCGGHKKSETQAQVETTQDASINLGEYFLAIAQLNNKCAADVEKANSAEEFVCAIEAYSANVEEFCKNVQNTLQNATAEDNRKYQKEVQEYEASTERMRIAFYKKQFSYTPAQQQRLENAMMRMASCVQ